MCINCKLPARYKTKCSPEPKLPFDRCRGHSEWLRPAYRLPDVEYIEIAPATHFAFLAECTENAPMILAEEGEDTICTDPEGTNRAAVHARIIAGIAKFLEL